jgi:hypothetical protein
MLGLTLPPTLIAIADEVIDQANNPLHLLHLLTAACGTWQTRRACQSMSTFGR